MITLSMIVRDEEAHLPGLLESARGLWDELVVVDTGSKDGTVALLREAGARVLHHAWSDDFSAARNVGLDAARGDWIVVLDADERPSPELVSAIRTLPAMKDAGAATVNLVNPLQNGHVRETPLLRVFRRDPDIRYRFAIHEDVSAPVAAWLGRTGTRLVSLPGTVLHLGYQREVARDRNKRARDERILRAEVRADPDDLYAWFKLLELACFWADPTVSREAATGAHAALARLPSEALRRLHYGGELLTLIARTLHPDPDEACAFFDRCAERVPPSPALFYERGCAHERRGRFAEAARDFSRCLALGGAHGRLQLTSVRPRMGLARLALARGDGAAARVHVEAALSAHPRDPEALLASAVDAVLGGQTTEAWISRRSAREGPRPELWSTAGELAMLLGRAAEAVVFFTRAGTGTAGGVGDWTRFAQALLCADEVAGAERLCEAHADEQVPSQAGRLVCALARGRPPAIRGRMGNATWRALGSWQSALETCKQTRLAAAVSHWRRTMTEGSPLASRQGAW